MADKRCANGHFIDEAWDLCPYCPPEAQEKSVAPLSPPAPAPAPAVQRAPSPAAAQTSAAVEAPPPAVQRTVAAPKSGPMPVPTGNRFVVGWLVGLNGIIRGESFPIRSGKNVLGRDRRSDVVIPDEQASAHHADLVYRPEERRFIVMDHNSTNGTYVNETEVEPRRDLSANDVIRIASMRYLFVPFCDDSMYWEADGVLK